MTSRVKGEEKGLFHKLKMPDFTGNFSKLKDLSWAHIVMGIVGILIALTSVALILTGKAAVGFSLLVVGIIVVVSAFFIIRRYQPAGDKMSGTAKSQPAKQIEERKKQKSVTAEGDSAGLPTPIVIAIPVALIATVIAASVVPPIGLVCVVVVYAGLGFTYWKVGNPIRYIVKNAAGMKLAATSLVTLSGIRHRAPVCFRIWKDEAGVTYLSPAYRNPWVYAAEWKSVKIFRWNLPDWLKMGLAVVLAVMWLSPMFSTYTVMATRSDEVRKVVITGVETRVSEVYPIWVIFAMGMIVVLMTIVNQFDRDILPVERYGYLLMPGFIFGELLISYLNQGFTSLESGSAFLNLSGVNMYSVAISALVTLLIQWIWRPVEEYRQSHVNAIKTERAPVVEKLTAKDSVMLLDMGDDAHRLLVGRIKATVRQLKNQNLEQVITELRKLSGKGSQTLTVEFVRQLAEWAEKQPQFGGTAEFLAAAEKQLSHT